MATFKQYGSSDRNVKADTGTKASAEEVEKFHTNSDVDLRAESQHHTLGPSPSQASPGDHRHDGGDSPLILSGFTITGEVGSVPWGQSVNAILVRLGANDDSTVP